VDFLPPGRARLWKAGDQVTLQMRAWMFDAPTQTAFYERFCAARKDFGISEKPNVLTFSQAFRLVSEKLEARNWDEEFGYYRHGMDRNSTKLTDFWQLGWVTGGITTLPLLLEGTPIMREHAMKNLDFLFTQSPFPNGLWRAHHDGKVWSSDDPRPPRPGYHVSVRRLGDVLFYGLRQIIVLKDRKIGVPPGWEASVRNLADALIRVWDRQGQLGQYLDIRSGDILIGNTEAGSLIPGGLVLAAEHFSEPRYLGKAGEIARAIADKAIENGFTTGGPCDALAAPDSESAQSLFTSLATLADATESAEWQGRAHDMLRQLATWITSYDFGFPEQSQCARAGIKSCGTVWANIQNKHAAPGLCVSSGESLLRYWRSTRDPLALELLRDISHCLPQFVPHKGRPVGTLDPGVMCERVNISAWEGEENVGGHIDFSAIWVETAMMLTACEIPGVYARTDTGELVVFDHIHAEWSGEPGTHSALKLSNPTDFDAVVTVLAESGAGLATPLPQEVLRNARRVHVSAHGQASISLP